jgi:hypothetical protein
MPNANPSMTDQSKLLCGEAADEINALIREVRGLAPIVEGYVSTGTPTRSLQDDAQYTAIRELVIIRQGLPASPRNCGKPHEMGLCVC